MGFLFGGSQTISTEEPRIGAVRIQTSAYGRPIPLLWGRNRLPGNLIWYGDFTAIPHTTTQSAGGKGGGGVTSSNTTYTYTAAVAIGMCEGEVSAIGQVWSGKDITSLAALGLTHFSGAYPQTAWGYLTSKHPGEAIGYNGLSYVASGALDLGSSASMPNLSFEAIGPLALGGGTDDADPKQIIVDFLTNPKYGAEFPAIKIGDLTAFSDYCVASGILLSPLIAEQQEAAGHLKQLFLMANAAPLWSEGVLKVIPYGDTAITANGRVYTPDITPRYDLDDDDFLLSGSNDPVECTRKQASDAYNHVQIEFLNKNKGYNVEIAEAKDQANIELHGLRTRQPEKMHAITDPAIAARLAQILLQRTLYVRNEYKFRLGWRYARLEPMDIVTITDEGLELIQAQVRIIAIEEDEDGELTVTAEEFPFGVATPAQFQTQPASGYSVDYNIAPGNSNAPVMFEPPIALAGEPQLWIATSGGTSWGGCDVWVSQDNTSYKKIGTIYGGARHGSLTAQFDGGGDPDLINALSVDLSASRGQLISGTQLDRDNFNTLCYVDGELVSYQTATLTGPNAYDLTSLRRGAYGSIISAHLIGAKFARLDEAIFKHSYDPSLVGSTLYLKFRSFNIYGGALQDLDALSPFTYSIQGAPMGAIGGLILEQPFIGLSAKIKWNAYPGASNYKVEVYSGPNLQRTTIVGETRYEYTFEDSKADGGPYRNLEFRVYALSPNGESTSAAYLAASNPQAAQVANPVAAPTIHAVNVSWVKSTETDIAGYRVYFSDQTGFTPDGTTLGYDGPANFCTIENLTPGTTYYFLVAAYDVFGSNNLNFTAGVSAAPLQTVAETATETINKINTVLADPNAPDKLIFTADHFAIYSPTANKYPFAISDLGGGVYATVLQSDVIINGNVSVANLTSGQVPSNVVMDLGGGMIQLDGAGDIRVFKAVGANQDYVSLQAGDITFKKWIGGSYVDYKNLRRLESGQAASGGTVNIPGYWEQQPVVQVSPSLVQFYSPTYSAQGQSIRCQANSLQENPPGSGQWQFTASAQLELSAGGGNTTINLVGADQSADSYTSPTYITQPNTTAITVNMRLRSKRGNGSSQYYYRQFRTRIDRSLDGTNWTLGTFSAYQDVGAVIDTWINWQQAYSFGSSNTWRYRVVAEWKDKDTSVFGAISYQYSTETLTNNPEQSDSVSSPNAVITTKRFTIAQMPASVVNAGWEIYEVQWQWDQKRATTSPGSNNCGGFSKPYGFNKWGWQHPVGANSSSSGWLTETYNSTICTQNDAAPAYTQYNFTQPTSAYDRQFLSVFYEAQGTNGFASTAWVYMRNISATVKRRTPLASSTTAVNTFALDNYDYTLSAAQVLASGTLNWMATGR